MEIKLTVYQKDHQALDAEAPGYLDALHAWSAEYCQACGEIERSLAMVLAAAIDQEWRLVDQGRFEAAAALDADVDRVLDAMSPAMLAHYDALVQAKDEGGR